MDDDAPTLPEPANLRFLRLLVTILTGTMIVGLAVLVTVFVARFPASPGLPPLPEGVALPEGAEPRAFTQGTGWIAVVTADDRILIFDRATGTLRQELRIAPE